MKRLTIKPETELKAHLLFSTLLFCTFLHSSANVFSQVNKLNEKNLEETMRNPWNPEPSGFIKDWLVLGPIPINGMEEIDKDFLAEHGGEAGIRPIEGQSLNVSGTEIKWMPVISKDIVDLVSVFKGGKTDNVVAYAYTTITREKAGKVKLFLGFDDGVKVWLNGKMVHRNPQSWYGITVDDNLITVDMNAGDNHLLLKLMQGGGGWGFVARIPEGIELNSKTACTINFSLARNILKDQTLTITSSGNIDQALFKQTVALEAYTTGGKMVAKRTFNCGEPVDLNYKTWTDGVYEFRMSYKDIRGMVITSYLSWYKGDILVAARELVNSAPGKDVRDPEASTHRMLADMVLDRLGNNLQNPDSSRLNALHSPLMEFAEIKAKKQLRPGGFIRMAYIDDIDNTPQFCRCYLPLDYDPSRKYPMVVFLHGMNDSNPEYYNWYWADKRHDAKTDRYGVIFIEPHGRGNTWYTGIGDREVVKCIEMAKQKFSVDNDRVYLIGESMGGFGTWNVGTRHPELFAAIAPIYGGGDYHANMSKEGLAKMSDWEVYCQDKSSSTAQADALLNMPILVSHGDQDFNGVPVDFSRYLVRLLQRWDYDVRYIEVPGKGHQDLGLWDQYMSWLLQYKRNIDPKQVRVRSADLRTASAYWVKISQRKSPFEFMVVDAEILPENIIRVDSKNVVALSLTPGKSLVVYSKPIRMVWNGKVSTVDKSTGQINLQEEGYKPLPIWKTPLLPGPISDFQNTPFALVIGTASKDSMMIKAIQQKADAIINKWKTVQKYSPRTLKDVDVTEGDMKKYSLFLLGGPDENTVSKKIFEKTGVRVAPDTIVVAGKPFKAKDAVLDAIYPNPYNAGRYVQIVAATSWEGFALFDPQKGNLSEYDFYITDAIIPNYKAGAKPEKIRVASGFFGQNWKISNDFLNAGDEELRSKCSSMKVNNDLSTSIVSLTTPSTELLRAYCGAYQFEGWKLTVSLEKDALKISQGNFSAEMSATSESEFFVREANAIIAFRKNETTNEYDMILYQGNGETTCKKVNE